MLQHSENFFFRRWVYVIVTLVSLSQPPEMPEACLRRDKTIQGYMCLQANIDQRRFILPECERCVPQTRTSRNGTSLKPAPRLH